MVTLSARSLALFSSLSLSLSLPIKDSNQSQTLERLRKRQSQSLSSVREIEPSINHHNQTMDVYGLSSQDFLRVDDLLDFSNEDIFSASSSTSTAATSSSSFPPPPNHHHYHHHLPSSADHSFLHDICVPSDDAAHLEWLSQFVDDSFADYPANPLGGTMTSVKTETTFPGKPRSKRSRAPAAFAGTWAPMPESDQQFHVAGKYKPKKEQSGTGGRDQSMGETAEGGMRRCTHCASDKTPQWRTGPLGPKTLCNACGVRFKSGRLVPEYRPASSPTFVLTQHSNSHRKVMELRRQKEVMRQPHHVQLQHHHQNQHHHPPF